VEVPKMLQLTASINVKPKSRKSTTKTRTLTIALDLPDLQLPNIRMFFLDIKPTSFEGFRRVVGTVRADTSSIHCQALGHAFDHKTSPCGDNGPQATYFFLELLTVVSQSRSWEPHGTVFLDVHYALDPTQNI
jgi:hypothetical protein